MALCRQWNLGSQPNQSHLRFFVKNLNISINGKTTYHTLGRRISQANCLRPCNTKHRRWSRSDRDFGSSCVCWNHLWTWNHRIRMWTNFCIGPHWLSLPLGLGTHFHSEWIGTASDPRLRRQLKVIKKWNGFNMLTLFSRISHITPILPEAPPPSHVNRPPL